MIPTTRCKKNKKENRLSIKAGRVRFLSLACTRPPPCPIGTASHGNAGWFHIKRILTQAPLLTGGSWTPDHRGACPGYLQEGVGLTTPAAADGWRRSSGSTIHRRDRELELLHTQKPIQTGFSSYKKKILLPSPANICIIPGNTFRL
jgi:hypothetical protein